MTKTQLGLLLTGVFMVFTAKTQVFQDLVVDPWGITHPETGNSPEFVDIDNDGDFDMFVGHSSGNISFYLNTGNATLPYFGLPQDSVFGLLPISENIPAMDFADIDSDGDFDLFIGSDYSKIKFYENVGSPTIPSFAPAIEDPFGIDDVTELSLLELVDLDGDGDLDLLMEAFIESFYYYENTGTTSAPAFAMPLTNPFGIECYSNFIFPVFSDLDMDGDFDLFYSSESGAVYFLRNIGSSSLPEFDVPEYLNENIGGIPDFVDIDNDGDEDVIVGDYGEIRFHENITLAVDLGITVMLSPTTACDLSAEEEITVVIENYGTEPQSNFPINYLINVVSGEEIICPETVLPGESITYTLPVTVDLSLDSLYYIQVYIYLPEDLNSETNFINKNVYNKKYISTTNYFEDFSMGQQGWFASETNSSWQFGTPVGPVINSSIYGDAWCTSCDWYYYDNESSYVESPCFDFGDISFPLVSLSLWYETEADYDGAVLSYSTDLLNWECVGTAFDENWYNNDYFTEICYDGGWSGSSGGWNSYSHLLPEAAGSPTVSFRLNFSSSPSNNLFDGIAFGSFGFCEYLSIDEESINKITFFPNPASDKLLVRNADNYTVQIIDCAGRIVYNSVINSDSYPVDLMDIESGMYVIEFYSKNIKWKDKLFISK